MEMLASKSASASPRFAMNRRGSSSRASPRAWRIAGIVLLALVLLKLWLVGAQGLAAAGGARIDDESFLRAAAHLVSGEWLGPYDERTLIKGPGYPLWIAAVFLAGLPLLFAEHLFYLAACTVFVAAVAPLAAERRRWGPVGLQSAVLWTILAFNPMSFSDGPMTRVTREGIYPALTLLVLAGAAALALRRGEPLRRRLPWAVLLGLALGAFWLTREEGVWLVPSVLLLTAAAVPGPLRPARRLLGRLAVLALPFGLAAACVAAVAGLNYDRYGEAVVVEIQAEPFQAAYGALARVGGEHFRIRVPVPEAARREIYLASPAFAELEPYLEGTLGRRWTRVSCRRIGICDDIAGGWFQWALREAAAGAGHHGSAPAAAAYYRRLADEVNRACATGRLACTAQRATLFPVWSSAYREPLEEALGRAVELLAGFGQFEAEPSASFGPPEALARFETLTRERLAPRQRPRIEIAGWAWSPHGDIGLRVRPQGRQPGGAAVETRVRFRASEAAGDLLNQRGFEPPRAPRARFTLTTSCTLGCRLEVLAGGRLVADLPLDGRPRVLDRSDLYLETWPAEGFVGETAAGTRLRDGKIAALEAIGTAYQTLTPPAVLLALAVYLALTAALAWERRIDAAWVLATALLGALAARVLLLSLIEVTSFLAIHRLYMAPAYPVLLAFVVLLLIPGGRRLARVLRASRFWP